MGALDDPAATSSGRPGPPMHLVMHGPSSERRGATRLVVTLGPEGPTTPSSGTTPGTDPASVAAALEAALTGGRQQREAAERALDERAGALDAEERALEARAAEHARHREGARAEAERRGAEVAAAVDRRRRSLDDAAAAAGTVAAAAGEWQRILEQHGDAEAALTSLTHRLRQPADPALASDPGVLAELEEGEAALQRSEDGRRAALHQALDGLTRAVRALDDGREPLLLAGLAHVRAAIDEAATADELAALADATRRVAEDRLALERERAALDEDAAPPAASVVLDHLLAGAPAEGPLVLDDALAALPDDVVGGVLAHLPEAVTGRGLVYLTDDVRVLSWAIGLPPEVGRVAGAVARAKYHE